jgi:AcrR family transcriptional regulator
MSSYESLNNSILTAPSEISPKYRILRVAEKLFAERGIDGVGIREIVVAAGLKNANSITYHFSTKDNLVQEVLLAGARKAEIRRLHWLDRLEASSRVISIRDIIKVLLSPTIERAVTPSYARLAAQLLMTQHESFIAALGADLVGSLERCNNHLQRLIKNVPKAMRDERIALMHIYFEAYLPTRDIRIETGENDGRWQSRHMIEHFIDTCEAMLTAMPSKASLTERRKFLRQQPKLAESPAAESLQFNLFDDLASLPAK